MIFRANQQVVCVDALDNPYGNPVPLIKGAVYTVLIPGAPNIRLVEFGPNFFWRASRFRPVSKPSIETFRAMLDSPPLKVVDA